MPADACRVPADDARGSKDAVPCDGGWLAARWRMLRRGQRMARSEMADAVQGVPGAACCAGGRQVLRRMTADGLRGGVARCCAVCCRWFVAHRQVARRGSKDAAPEASGWCVEGRRVASRRRSGTIFSPLEL